ncbi:hypothetical protein LAJ19_08630 [Deinococcus taeanensis]|uniref:hypothetical protein n=1 Tax=Deinococcus taeanensis TaxID=2737050 RepID=UPI001CDBF027|nr:hypothetical protein [Deinococcus taeanensis]UBV41716.1 hypothetical protein LAJ19_08630 [Deinococcus taeanensis]
MNEWLLNGTWRLRVTGIRFVPSPKDRRPWGWVVTTETRNGGRQALSLDCTGIEEGISVTLKNGD